MLVIESSQGGYQWQGGKIHLKTLFLVNSFLICFDVYIQENLGCAHETCYQLLLVFRKVRAVHLHNWHGKEELKTGRHEAVHCLSGGSWRDLLHCHCIWIFWNIRIIFLLRSLPATVTSRFQEGGKSFSKRYILTRNTRYKHFDWLHLQLVKKFGGVIAIPPLPEKQVLIATSFPTHRDYIDGFCWNKHLKLNFPAEHIFSFLSRQPS